MLNKRKKNFLKNKKVYILICCYLFVCLITIGITSAWFAGSTWSDKTLYMGGPVYISVADNQGITCGDGALNVATADDLNLFPGMNMKFQVRALIIGREWQKKLSDGSNLNYVNTTCVLRSRLKVVVTNVGVKEGEEIRISVYNDLFDKICSDSTSDTNTGSWFYNSTDDFFYYMKRKDTKQYSVKDLMEANGGTGVDSYVDFVNNVLIDLPGKPFTNVHAKAKITFSVMMQAVQGVVFWDKSDHNYAGQKEGTEKPRTIENIKKLFIDCFGE